MRWRSEESRSWRSDFIGLGVLCNYVSELGFYFGSVGELFWDFKYWSDILYGCFRKYKW